MNDREINLFKHNLSDLNTFKSEVKRLQQEINDLEYSKRPYRSPQFDEPLGTPKGVPFPYDKVEKINKLIEEKEKEIDHYVFFIQKVDNTLSKILDPKIKETLVRIYVNGESSKDVCIALCYGSISLMHKTIVSCLKKIQ